MATLSATQIASYAYQAGFRGADLVIAVAVAFAESGGNPSAINTTNANGSRDYGLWQINSVHSDLLASGSWSNPADNARMAYSVWKGSGWRAWASYTSGSYRSHLSNATHAVGSGTFVSNISAPTFSTPPPFKVDDLSGARRIFCEGKVFRRTDQHDWNQDVQVYDPKGSDKTGAHLPDQWPSVIAMTRMASWLKTESKNPDIAADVNNTAVNSYLGGQHTSGNMRQIMSDYSLIVHAPPTVGVIPGEGTITDAASALYDLFKWLFNPQNWIRVAEFVGGGLLIVIALYRLASGSLPTPLKAVAKVIPG